MSEPDSELLRFVRRAVLANRYARQGCAQTSDAILASLRLDDRSISYDQVLAALDYLEKKGLVSAESDMLAAGVRYWEITAAGIDAYEF